MHPAQLRNVDLNLLLPLQALLHERNVTRAAERVNLSQSVMSRILNRLRSELGDDLLVRMGRRYELTPRGSALLEELGQLLPRIARVWAGEQFSPSESEVRVRLAMTDYASSVVLPPLAALCGRLAPGLSLEVTPWHPRVHEEDGVASIHLILSAVSVPATFRTEPLFDDHFVCLLGRKLNRNAGPLTMREYLSFRHISVETRANQQNITDRTLGESGLRRRVAIHLPYILPALRTLETTDMVLTIPARIAEPMLPHLDLRCLKVPKEIPVIRHSMVWHPRLDTDLLHAWFRDVVRDIFRTPSIGQK
jgi:DNA-binding transcriptional LysR family regulator